MTELASFEKALRDFESWQLTAFCAAVSERMFPNFGLFSQLVGFGERERMRTVLDGVWSSLSGKGAKINFEVQLDHVEANIPDLNEYDMYGAMPARDAVVALYSTLVCAQEGDADEAVNVSNLSRETVATFIEVNEASDQMSDEELVRFINTHELMQIEDGFQQDVIDLLGSRAQPNAALIDELKTLAYNEGYSNLGIGEQEE